MALPVFTSDDFTVIRTHVRNVKNGYFVNVTFVAVIVIFIFYFFTLVLPTEEIVHFFNGRRDVPVYNPLTSKYGSILIFYDYPQELNFRIKENVVENKTRQVFLNRCQRYVFSF